jgi:hypothetical protein
MKYILIILFSVGFVIELYTQNLPQNFKSLNPKFPKQQSETYIFFAFDPDCPISRYYVTNLKSIDSICKSNNIVFTAVIPGNLFTDSELREYEKLWALPFVLYRDDGSKLLKALKAKITPEFFVFHKKELVYKGAFDNAYFAPAKKRTVVTEHYVRKTIETVISNQSPEYSENPAIGCFITYR